jgi:hypothetical protein
MLSSMTNRNATINVYLEVSQKRTMAGALDWPGWCRGGANEEAALEALLAYAARYAEVVKAAPLGFAVPSAIAQLAVVQRIQGDSGTDYGVPAAAPAQDGQAVDDVELERLSTILKLCGQAFDDAVKRATGKTLRKGPRGGGREVEGIVRHVMEADGGYIKQAGAQFTTKAGDDLHKQLGETRAALLDALARSARGELPTRGPRGGIRWPARYFARRVAWHELDHAWEIEDRME